MKKAILIISLSMAIAACSSNSNNNNNGDTSSTKQDAVAQNSNAAVDTVGSKNGTEATGTSQPAAQASAGNNDKGESLIASSDCNTCHKMDMKLVGPSFQDIAARYTDADVDRLAEKVIKGGSGSWGEVAMTPHPSLNITDVKVMVRYILSHGKAGANNLKTLKKAN